MPHPDLSNVKALIADDRDDVRQWLSTSLRQAGVADIDLMPAGVGGRNLVALLARDTVTASSAGSRAAEPLGEAVSRFSHDIASPLMCVLALSGLLVREARAGNSTAEDLRRIQAAAEEIAVMVRALGERATPGGAMRHTRPS